jgi:hypothetical protein
MPRQRKAARAFRKTERMTAAVMRKRFENPELLWWITVPGKFFEELPTRAERRLFLELFPREFYELFGFFAHESDEWPASTMYELRGIFRRPQAEFMAMLQERPPRVPFNAPDVNVLPYRERDVTLARARGEWWRANGLPTRRGEIRWMDEKEN